MITGSAVSGTRRKNKEHAGRYPEEYEAGEIFHGVWLSRIPPLSSALELHSP